MFCILNGPDHVFEFVNKAHIEALGFDATGMAVRVAQPESVEVHGILDDVYRTGVTANLHEIPVTLGKELRYFDLTYSAKRGPDGRVNGIMVLGAEVTNRVLADQKVDYERKRLFKIIEQIPAAIALVGKDDLRFEMMNSAHARLYGSNRSLIGIPLKVAIPDISDDIVEAIRKTIETGERQDFKEYAVTIDWTSMGSPELKYFNLTYEPFREANGAIVGALIFAFDVTDYVLSRQKLAASERKFKLFIDSMPQMVFIANGRGDIVDFNQRWYEYIGAIDETEGWGWKNKPIHHPDDLEKTLETWQRSIQKGEPYEMEYRLRRHDGVYRWHLGRALPIKNDRGQITHWFGTNTDIQDQKEAIQARDNFLSIASHELKTPVTSIKLQMQMMKRSPLTDEKTSKGLSKSLNQVDRLTALVDDLLDVSKISSGKMSYNFEVVEVFPLIEEVIEKFSEEISLSNSSVRFSGDKTLTAPLDKFRFEQVITNLISNAIKYGNQCKEPIEINLSLQEETVFIKVKDNGMGIAPENLTKIFDRFERAVGSNHISGLGLGLYISRQIIEAHHGKIYALSELGKGSTFVIELPRGK